MPEYTHTTTSLARAAEVAPDTVRRYANLGMLDYRLASDGTRLFAFQAVEAVRRICAARLANRGRRAAK